MNETTITEDYVSFEVAKLLKEKGFDIPCHAVYDIAVTGGTPKFNKYEVLNHFPHGMKNSDDKYGMVISAPTYQEVMKWLRTKHNLSIEVYRTACGYVGCIVAIPSGTDIKFFDKDGDDLSSGQYTKWEYACEAAIKYYLEHLETLI